MMIALAEERLGKKGIDTIGCVGVLEEAFRLKLIPDLRAAYSPNVRVRRLRQSKILEQSLRDFNLLPL